MKFYRTLRLNKQNARSLDLTYRTDGQIIMDSTNPDVILRALRIPTGTGDPEYTPGTPENQRPLIPYDINGLLRFNTSLEALEVLKNGVWIQLRAKEPANIVQQTFVPPPVAGYDASQTYVDGTEIYFGPLIGPQNQPPFTERSIFVYVENVFQIPGTNYTLVESTDFLGYNPPYPTGKYLQFNEPPPIGKNVTVIHGFD